MNIQYLLCVYTLPIIGGGPLLIKISQLGAYRPLQYFVLYVLICHRNNIVLTFVDLFIKLHVAWLKCFLCAFLFPFKSTINAEHFRIKGQKRRIELG